MRTVQLRLQGQIDPRWSEWLDGLTITHNEDGETMLTGAIPDQSALYGLLSKLRDLGLALVAVKLGEEVPANERPACPLRADRTGRDPALTSLPSSSARRRGERR